MWYFVLLVWLFGISVLNFFVKYCKIVFDLNMWVIGVVLWFIKVGIFELGFILINLEENWLLLLILIKNVL